MSLAHLLCWRVLSARVASALLKRLSHALRKTATLRLPDSTATGLIPAAAARASFVGQRPLWSPIWATREAAVSVVFGLTNKGRKILPSGWARTALAILSSRPFILS